MKKVLLLMAGLLGGMFAGVLAGVFAGVIAGLLIPAEQRKKLSQSLAAPIGRCLAHMPDG